MKEKYKVFYNSNDFSNYLKTKAKKYETIIFDEAQ